MKTYKLSVEMVRQVTAINRRIERRDADLARQLRRASMSVPPLSPTSTALGATKGGAHSDAVGGGVGIKDDSNRQQVLAAPKPVMAGAAPWRVRMRVARLTPSETGF